MSDSEMKEKFSQITYHLQNDNDATRALAIVSALKIPTAIHGIVNAAVEAVTAMPHPENGDAWRVGYVAKSFLRKVGETMCASCPISEKESGQEFIKAFMSNFPAIPGRFKESFARVITDDPPLWGRDLSLKKYFIDTLGQTMRGLAGAHFLAHIIEWFGFSKGNLSEDGIYDEADRQLITEHLFGILASSIKEKKRQLLDPPLNSLIQNVWGVDPRLVPGFAGKVGNGKNVLFVSPPIPGNGSRCFALRNFDLARWGTYGAFGDKRIDGTVDEITDHLAVEEGKRLSIYENIGGFIVDVENPNSTAYEETQPILASFSSAVMPVREKILVFMREAAKGPMVGAPRRQELAAFHL
jgi:hypothetical protein